MGKGKEKGERVKEKGCRHPLFAIYSVSIHPSTIHLISPPYILYAHYFIHYLSMYHL